MTKIHRKLEYALIALKYMAAKQPGQLTSAKELTDKLGLPFDAVSRALQTMAQKRLLRSEHGAQGGYQIVRDLSRVSLYEVMEAVLGPLEIVKCVGEKQDCDLFGRCNVQSPLLELNTRLKDFYRSMSLQALLKIEAKPVRENVVDL